MPRNPRLAQVHIARKDLALPDDCYRAILNRITGQESSAGLNDTQLDKVLAEFKRLGWSPKPVKGKATASAGQRHRPASDKAHVRKVFAIWTDMCKANIPVIANRAGLLAFVQRMTGVDDPEWMTPEQAQVVTEALKSWRKRELAKREAR
jgi:phage gp16-like protein